MATKVDPRGPRFAATVTTVMLTAVLVTGNVWVLAAQGAVFAIAVLAGPARSPYGILYSRLVRPALKPPDHLEDAAPPRFAQAVGLAFSVAGLAGYLSGLTPLAYIAVGAALAAAFLNAAFGFCLGCELYLIVRRTFHRLSPTRTNTTATEVTS